MKTISALLSHSCTRRNVRLAAALILITLGPGAYAQVFPFCATGSGPFTTTPISPTVVRQDQQLTFTSASPFLLINGSIQGFDNLTLPFPDRFFNGTFAWFGAAGDAVFGTLTVQTSVFTDPVDPAHGDFVGAEDFTGTFLFTSGTGHFTNASGGGTYMAHSDYGPPVVPGTLFSGFTTVSGTGILAVPDSGKTGMLLALSLCGIVAFRRRN